MARLCCEFNLKIILGLWYLFDDIAMSVCVELLYTQHPTRARPEFCFVHIFPRSLQKKSTIPSCVALFFSLSDPGKTRVSELPTSQSDIWKALSQLTWSGSQFQDRASVSKNGRVTNPFYNRSIRGGSFQPIWQILLYSQIGSFPLG